MVLHGTKHAVHRGERRKEARALVLCRYRHIDDSYGCILFSFGKRLCLTWPFLIFDMGTLYLSVELAFDFIAFVLGVVLVFQAKDNYLKLFWGIIAACIGLFFIWENVGWLVIVTDTPEYRFTTLLSIDKMLKWYALASVVSLFPMASLYPGYFNHWRLLAFLFPPVVLITVGLCYLCFNGAMTPIHFADEILANLDKTDVRLRLAIFLCSILFPLAYFIYPLASRRSFRQINRCMYGFIGFMFLFLGIYITFTLSINEFVFNLFGIVALVFTLLFSVIYLFRENPFSSHVLMLLPADSASLPLLEEAVCDPLFTSIDTYLRQTNAYADKAYTIGQLAESLGEKERLVSQAIKSGGFTGFREYINYLRLEYFKQLASTSPDKNIKELIYLCGFTSRTTFYRIFTEKFGISPTQFIDKL